MCSVRFSLVFEFYFSVWELALALGRFPFDFVFFFLDFLNFSTILMDFAMVLTFWVVVLIFLEFWGFGINAQCSFFICL